MCGLFSSTFFYFHLLTPLLPALVPGGVNCPEKHSCRCLGLILYRKLLLQPLCPTVLNKPGDDGRGALFGSWARRPRLVWDLLSSTIQWGDDISTGFSCVCSSAAHPAEKLEVISEEGLLRVASNDPTHQILSQRLDPPSPEEPCWDLSL